jgi:predicted PurR-regulated permease PerM
LELNKKNIIKLLLIIFISILLFTTIQNYSAFLSSVSKIWKTLLPFVTGLCIAFILNIPMKFFENKLFKSKNKKT